MGGKLAERWSALLLSPAFAFWGAGAAAWLWTRSSADQRERALDDLARLSDLAQAVVLVGALLVIAASGLVVERLALTVIRLLEGYWPRALQTLRRRLTARGARRKEEAEQRWGALQARWETGTASADEVAELVALERSLAALPADARELMPTRLGNVLRAAESRPGEKYGLDAVQCWPRLWLVLPDATKQEIGAAGADLNTSATWWTWGALVAVWTVFTPLALVVAAVAAALAYGALVGSAMRYGQLVEAAFDVHRGLLYDALGRPRPEHAAAERRAGQEITQLLLRGPATTSEPAAAEIPAEPSRSPAAS
jgi:hypothetical protein